MSTSAFNPDDPRLTAYALGELDDAERAEVESHLESSAEARAAVDEIRRTAGLLTGAFTREPALSLDASRRAAIETEAAGPSNEPAKPVARRSRTAVLSVAAAVAALTATIIVVLWPPGSATWDRSESKKATLLADRGTRTPMKDQGGNSVDQHVPVAASPDDGRASYKPADRQGQMAGGKLVEQQLPAMNSSTTLRPSEQRLPSLADSGPPISDELKEMKRIELSRPQSTLAQTKGMPAGQSGRPEKFRVQLEDRLVAGPRPQRVRELAKKADGQDLKSRRHFFEYLDEPSSGESYAPIVENDFLTPFEHPLSTFSIDVDTAAYSNVRRFLKAGRFPPADAVRIEELVNYFHYDYPQPTGEHPFSASMEVGACPWNPEHRLVRIGLKGREIPRDKRPPSSLVFLIDVSGSMSDPNKLPLVKAALEMLVVEMTENDRIAIVTYAGNAGLLLESTPGHEKEAILAAIARLNASGSTNGEAGIKLAYEQAMRYRIDEGTNRIILCTDGDFNVGVSDDDQLVRMVQDYAKESRVFLSIFGFGMGNLKDSKLEKLADKGNGHYAYIDGRREAEIVFVEEMTGTLYTIAKDVKIQVEFNPARVGAYRLIGYENRALQARDFNDDTKDAGDIGAGHTVTALYEIAPPGKLPRRADIDGLKYQKREKPKLEAKDDEASDELLTLKLRYKPPEGDKSIPQEFPLVDKADKGEKATGPSRDFQWAAAVAGFGLVLRDSQHKGRASLGMVRELAADNLGTDQSGRRREFIELLDLAREIESRRPAGPQREKTPE